MHFFIEIELIYNVFISAVQKSDSIIFNSFTLWFMTGFCKTMLFIHPITQSCPILCDPMECIPPGFSVHWILQARILERDAIAFSRGSSQPRD